MKKSDRQKVFDKYDGKCAYCGCELVKGWHVDELEPLVRNFTYNRDKGKYVHDGTCRHPERLHINNQNPACASCNIMKSSESLEAFRNKISAFVNSLNQYHTQYKFAKRYGLVVETVKPVVFYFETLI
ncbi:HNH endonuclease [Pedobacter ureilyticus]|uniref:HNH endonuclease n=1 Tax=Pedobacter ureilyticus TaxID=1393051 RepID=A0ABW9J2Y2_9SPHI|nr:HNH endonuclease [Pedobacter helvus]